jgi:hypothetical protein
MASLLHDIRRGASPETQAGQQVMQLGQGGDGYSRRAKRFCQHSRQTWRQEMGGELRLRCPEDGEGSGGTTEMKQAAAVGGDVLVVAGLEAKEVAEFVVASAEALR